MASHVSRAIVPTKPAAAAAHRPPIADVAVASTVVTTLAIPGTGNRRSPK